MEAHAPARIGPYQVLAVLGRGGMADVYRARDTRFGREVALKLMRGDGDRPPDTARLLAEARAAGRLSHPHVIAVLDVGSHGDRAYLVTELVEGVSLRHLIDGRPMPLSRALALAIQMADGLAAAHRAGIVHRDFKPENVMVDRHDRAIIVDFGLAKDTAPIEGGEPRATITAPHTVLGTVAYMSPEQARGAALDARTDQFSFGAVFYEMLTGTRAFDGASAVETLAAILKEPHEPLATRRGDVPPPLRWIVDRCLAKRPDDRYASTDDLLFELRAAAARSAELAAAATPTRAWSRREALVGVGAGAAAALGLGWLSTGRSPAATAPLPVWRRLTFEQGFVDAARFSRDGDTVIYSASWRNQPFAVYSTTLTSPESRPLDLPPAGILGIAPSGELAISLDCTFVAANGACAGTLARVPLLGGAPKAIATGVRAADWGRDGSLAIARVAPGGYYAVVEYPPGNQLSDRGIGHVRVSPDGTRVAWSVETDTSRNGIVVQDIDGSRTLSENWTFISGMAWSASGESLLVSGVGPLCADDAVVRVGFDGTSDVILRGAARLRVLDAGAQGRLLIGASLTTTRLFVWRAGAAQPSDLTWLDNSSVDAVSPDGQRVLFTVRAASVEFAPASLYPVFVRSSDGGPPQRLGSGYGVALSNDGQWALLRTRPDAGPAELVLVTLGPGEPRTLPRGGVDIGRQNSLVSFAGSDRLVMRAREGDSPWRTYEQSLTGGPPRLLAHEPGVIVSPMAPDGERFIAERSDGSYWLSHTADGRGGESPLPLTPATRILQWTTDGRALIVATFEGRDRTIVWRFDLASGRLTALRELAPIAAAGLNDRRGLTASRDATIVAETKTRTLGHLYLVEAARS